MPKCELSEDKGSGILTHTLSEFCSVWQLRKIQLLLVYKINRLLKEHIFLLLVEKSGCSGESSCLEQRHFTQRHCAEVPP